MAEKVYTLKLAATGWECGCPGAFNFDGECGSAREAASTAVHHVRYYGDTWPHRIERVAA